jgi:hypothetical protein
MSEPIDLARVTQLRKELAELVKAHPELTQPEAQTRLTQWLRDERMKSKQELKPVFVRLPKDLIQRIDTFVDILANTQPGLKPTRSDAIRMLLYRGLEAMEISTRNVP